MESPTARRTLRGKDERLARTYDEEIHPLFVRRMDQLIIQALTRVFATESRKIKGTQMLEVACGAGGLTNELLRRLDPEVRLIATDASSALIELAKERVADEHPGRRVFFRTQNLADKLPFSDGNFDLVAGKVSIDEVDSPEQTLAELARVVRPGGWLVLALPLPGVWAEFLDLLREVLIKRWDMPALAALERYQGRFLEPEALITKVEALGFSETELVTERWELLFRTAREFFYAPVIELGPLRRWKEIVGKGEVMQGVFNDVRESIDTYFSGRSFPVGIVAGCISARRTIAAGAGSQ